MTYDQLVNKVRKQFPNGQLEKDNYGQFIIYTGLDEDDKGDVKEYIAE